MTDATAALDVEDRKIIQLARAVRLRNAAPEGAAVRDHTGRTYAASTVALESLKLTAVQAAVVMAAASGATCLAAAAVVTTAAVPAEADRAAVHDLGGPDARVLVAGPDGTVRAVVTEGRPSAS